MLETPEDCFKKNVSAINNAVVEKEKWVSSSAGAKMFL